MSCFLPRILPLESPAGVNGMPDKEECCLAEVCLWAMTLYLLDPRRVPTFSLAWLEAFCNSLGGGTLWYPLNCSTAHIICPWLVHKITNVLDVYMYLYLAVLRGDNP